MKTTGFSGKPKTCFSRDKCTCTPVPVFDPRDLIGDDNLPINTCVL